MSKISDFMTFSSLIQKPHTEIAIITVILFQGIFSNYSWNQLFSMKFLMGMWYLDSLVLISIPTGGHNDHKQKTHQEPNTYFNGNAFHSALETYFLEKRSSLWYISWWSDSHAKTSMNWLYKNCNKIRKKNYEFWCNCKINTA